jgi:hypothetical protein
VPVVENQPLTADAGVDVDASQHYSECEHIISSQEVMDVNADELSQVHSEHTQGYGSGDDGDVLPDQEHMLFLDNAPEIENLDLPEFHEPGYVTVQHLVDSDDDVEMIEIAKAQFHAIMKPELPDIPSGGEQPVSPLGVDEGAAGYSHALLLSWLLLLCTFESFLVFMIYVLSASYM